MLSPCLNCSPLDCVLGARKKDCLTGYDNLIRIGNSKAGFAGTEENPDSWPQLEREFYYKQLERKVEMAAPKRGRPAKATQASQLLEALAFVEVGTNDFQPWHSHVRLSGNMAISFNGQVAAGHPIAEELTLCPQLDKLKMSLQRCGKSLVISETPGCQLSVKGDKLRALVPCMQATELPPIEPDAPVVQFGEQTGDVFKAAFKVCNSLASEAGERVIEASLLLEASTCTGTNGYVMLQYWHGIDLPPHMVLPKLFTAAVAKQAKPITGFGFSWGYDGYVNSVTFWFEGGAWIKTQCYQDRWQDIDPIINVPSYPIETPAGLFEGIEAVHSFNETKWVYFADEKVMSHDTDLIGAQYDVKGLQGGKCFNGDFMAKIAPYAKTIDLTTYPDKCYFFGGEPSNPIRGCVMGIGAPTRQHDAEYQPEATANAGSEGSHDETMWNSQFEELSEAEADQSQGWGGGWQG